MAGTEQKGAEADRAGEDSKSISEHHTVQGEGTGGLIY